MSTRPLQPAPEDARVNDVDAAIANAARAAAAGRAPTNPDTAPSVGEWVVRCTECAHTRTTASLGVRVNRRRVFNARTTALCPSCGWVRRHAIERFGEGV